MGFVLEHWFEVVLGVLVVYALFAIDLRLRGIIHAMLANAQAVRESTEAMVAKKEDHRADDESERRRA